MKNVLKMTVLGCLLLSSYTVKSSDRTVEVSFGGISYMIKPGDERDYKRLSRIPTTLRSKQDQVLLNKILGIKPPVALKPSKHVKMQDPASSSCAPCTYSSPCSSSSTRPSQTNQRDLNRQEIDDSLVFKRMAFSRMDQSDPNYQTLKRELEILSIQLAEALELEQLALERDGMDDASLQLVRKLEALDASLLDTMDDDNTVRAPIPSRMDCLCPTMAYSTEDQWVDQLIRIYINAKDLDLNLDQAIEIAALQKVLKKHEREALEIVLGDKEVQIEEGIELLLEFFK